MLEKLSEQVGLDSGLQASSITIMCYGSTEWLDVISSPKLNMDLATITAQEYLSREDMSLAFHSKQFLSLLLTKIQKVPNFANKINLKCSLIR